MRAFDGGEDVLVEISDDPKAQVKKAIEGMQESGQSFVDAAHRFQLMLSGLASLSDKTADLITELVEDHQAQIKKIREGTEGRVIQERGPDATEAWYAGPRKQGRYWPPLYEAMKNGKMAGAADSVDTESTNILALTANPAVRYSSVRGLVVGHVQSGKTANFTAVMAKAADEGYRFFVVLAGMHNNLRRQTQVRLEKDLFRSDSAHPWHRLTTPDSDFGEDDNGNAFFQAPDKPIVVVVKKNATVLQNLVDFLGSIPENLRADVPAMIIDDESDQATPNTKADKEALSKINELVRTVWKLLPTGTYLAYTATPFANVLMDPDDESELYPRDFTYPLPRPDTYFGAAKVFGISPHFDLDKEEGGLNIVRTVPEDEVRALSPSKKELEHGGYPGIVPSLVDAIAWFVVATAIRHARGDDNQHSSMLVNNTHLIDPHAVQRSVLAEHVEHLRASAEAGEVTALKAAYDAEADRIVEAFDNTFVPWEQVLQHLPRVLGGIEVIMDNGQSLKRLDYPDDEPQILIVVGGNTLSRGLTLEGLVVSHFARRTSVYDTLLQMGRWFGYRTGYEDLVRVWTSAQLEQDYRFLAGVEEEVREHLVSMARNGESPRDIGVRIRSHPGRLEITAQNKMFFAEKVSLQLGGNRMQTTVFDPRNLEVLKGNQNAARKLVRDAGAAPGAKPAVVDGSTGSVLLQDVPEALVTRFLSDYVVHGDHHALQPERTLGWIQSHGEGRPWNVVLRSTSRPGGSASADKVFDFGDGHQVALVHRSPREHPEDRADIRALMPGGDMLIDLSITARASGKVDPFQVGDDTDEMKKRRYDHGNVPLLVLYAINKNSRPRDTTGQAPPRRPLEAEEHVVGLGLVLHQVDGNDAEYVAVKPTLKEDPELELENTIAVEDDEPDAELSPLGAP